MATGIACEFDSAYQSLSRLPPPTSGSIEEAFVFSGFLFCLNPPFFTAGDPLRNPFSLLVTNGCLQETWPVSLESRKDLCRRAICKLTFHFVEQYMELILLLLVKNQTVDFDFINFDDTRPKHIES